MRIDFTLNGRSTTVDVDPMRRLLDVIREDLGLTGTKEGCGEGECGACSVLIDGKLANSCLVPIVQVAGGEVTTIEGLNDGAIGNAITQAFAETHAVQCGFCTPGMVVATAAFLSNRLSESAENPEITETDIRHALSGNICRCTGYDMIVDGVLEAARRIDATATGWSMNGPSQPSASGEGSV